MVRSSYGQEKFMLAPLLFRCYIRANTTFCENYMKKRLAIIFTALSIIIMLDSLNAVEALFMFLLGGVIPGTNVVVSGARMLEVFTLLIGFTLSRVTLNLLRHTSMHRTQPTVHVSNARA